MSSTPPALGPEGFCAATGVSRETLERLARYAGLLETWSRSINLVGRRSLADLWRRHMLDSAQLMELMPPAPPGRPRRIVDLGTGAGFPGLVLAILGAGEVHLIESDQKKVSFLRAAARASGAEVTIHAARIENLAPIRADLVTARALAPLPKLLAIAAPFLGADAPVRPRGGEQANTGANIGANGSVSNRSLCSPEVSPVALLLKGEHAERELTDSRETWMMSAEVFSSRSDPRGRILRLSGLARKEP